MSPPGRPKGEQAPERDSAEGGVATPPGRPKGEQAPERDSAEGGVATPPGRPKGEQAPERDSVGTLRRVRAVTTLAASLWLAACATPPNLVIITPEEEQAPELVQVPSPLIEYPPIDPVEPPLDSLPSSAETPASPPTAMAPATTVAPIPPAPGPSAATATTGGASPSTATPAPPSSAPTASAPPSAPAPSAPSAPPHDSVAVAPTFSSAPAMSPPRAAAPAAPSAADLELLALLSDLQRYGTLGTEDIRRELNNATNLLARQRTDANRVRLAILFTLSRANPQDDQRAVLLLENVVKGNGSNPGIKELAVVLQVQIAGRQRAVRDEQQKADTALQKLEALRQMERSLIRDRVRSGGGGGGGGGGGSGGGGGGSGGGG